MLLFFMHSKPVHFVATTMSSDAMISYYDDSESDYEEMISFRDDLEYGQGKNLIISGDILPTQRVFTFGWSNTEPTRTATTTSSAPSVPPRNRDPSSPPPPLYILPNQSFHHTADFESHLHQIARNGELERFKELTAVQHKYNPSELTAKGRTVLHSACEGGQTDMVIYLTRTLCMDPLRKDSTGQTPLDLCTNKETRGILQTMIGKFHLICKFIILAKIM